MTERVTQLAMSLTDMLNALGMVAAPKAWAQWDPGIDKIAAIRQTLEEALKLGETLGGMDGLPERFVPELERFVAVLPHDALTDQNVADARALLERFGIPEPPGGWDAFDGTEA